MILSFRINWSGQVVQTQIRLLLEEQSDQGLHYLQYCLHLSDTLLFFFSSFMLITAKFSGIRKFRNFKVLSDIETRGIDNCRGRENKGADQTDRIPG